jgi:hypothetical protein
VNEVRVTAKQGSDGDVAPVENGAAPTGPTLDELAERLSELREHLDQVVASLNELREDESGIGEDVRTAISAYGSGDPGSEQGGLRCHECGRSDATEEAGWTLRLCGDDELHPFCPDCDRRRVGSVRQARGT